MSSSTRWRTCLHESGLEARYLTIEVTESVLMHDAEEAIFRLRQLKGLGVKIAIDDFGTGYSSLAYLRQFPVDMLKIDRSFVSSSNDAQGRALLHTMVQLGRSMGLETVAEGIEREPELRLLQAEGCDTGQGFLLGRPMGKDVAVGLPDASTRRHGSAGGGEHELTCLASVQLGEDRRRCPRRRRSARRSG